MKKLFFGFILFFAALTQGWGAPTTQFNAGTYYNTSNSIVLTVSVSNANNSPVTLNYSTSDDTAIAGVNYVASSGTITIPKNTSSGTLTFSILPTNDFGINKQFKVTLSNPSNGSLGATKTATVVISTIDNQKNFSSRYKNNIYGDYNLTGGTAMCQAGNGGVCNWAYNGAWYDSNTQYVNDLATTVIALNSSSGKLVLPSDVVGSKIKWAGLYWQGHIHNSSVTTRSVDVNGYNKVILRTPDNVNHDITSDASSTSFFTFAKTSTDAYRFFYSCFADVTSFVQSTYASSANTFTVGNIKSNIGTDVGINDPFNGWGGLRYGHFGGWSLVVAYERDPSSQVYPKPVLKNISLYDGYNILLPPFGNGNSQQITIDISDFLTPRTGNISSSMYFFAGAGEPALTTLSPNSYTGSMSITNKAGTKIYASNSANTKYNVLNDTYTYFNGYLTSGRQFIPGLDLDVFDTSSILSNDQSSTKIEFTAGCSSNACNEGFVSAIGFATQIYQPLISITKQANTSGILQPSSTISYAAYMKNSGEEAASNITVFDDFTSNQLYDTDGQLTNPAVYLSDIMDKNATKILKTIRLTDINGTTLNHCPTGVTGSGCVYSDANCAVDYTGDPETTATKIWCKIPTLEINATINMTFSVDLVSDAVSKTKNQNVGVTNVMAATYYNALTGQAIAIPATSNSATAGELYGKIGAFDAWETGLSKDTARLYTKVTADQFTLNVGTNASFTGAACAAVVDSAVTDPNDAILTGGGYQCQDYTSAFNPFSWTISKAARKAKIKIKYKAYGTAASVNTSNPNWSGWDDSSSSDVFAIRPPYLLVSSTPSPVMVQKAGDDAKVVDINTSTPGYNQSPSRLTLNILEWLKIDGSALGVTPNKTETLALSGTDFDSLSGNTNGAIFIFSDVGRFKVDISDRNWTTDSGDVAGNDCLTTAANYVDANTMVGGKYGCYVMLNPQSGIDLRFIPYKFMITDASIANANGGSFTYFSSDISSTYGTAATIPMTITAVNKDEVATANYASGLYEQAITLTPTGLSPDGYTPVSSVANGAILGFNDGSKTLSATDANAIKFNFSRSYSTLLDPLTINGSNTSISATDADSVSGSAVPSGSASFLYGRVHMPSTNANAGDTVRAFAEVYATSSASLPAGTWVNAPGSTTWWVNSLHGSTLGGINATVVKINSTLNNTTSLFSVGSPDISGGKFEFLLPSNLTDQQVLLHFDVPTYLWHGANSYSYGTDSDCSQHPCGKVEIFGTDIKQWYGTGDKKGDKAIQTVPKGKRAPKVNW